MTAVGPTGRLKRNARRAYAPEGSFNGSGVQVGLYKAVEGGQGGGQGSAPVCPGRDHRNDPALPGSAGVGWGEWPVLAATE